LTRAQSRHFKKTSGRHYFLKDLFAANKAKHGSSQKMSKAAREAVMAQHAQLWAALSPAELQYYHDAAARGHVEQAEAQAQEVAFQQTAIDLAAQRQAQEASEVGLTHGCSDIRFGPSDYERIAALLDSPSFQQKQVTKLRATALQSPERPSDAQLEVMLRNEPTVYLTQAQEKVKASALIKRLAAARDHLRGWIFANGRGQGASAWLFLFAQLSPISMHFMALEMDHMGVPTGDSGHNAAGQHAEAALAWSPYRWRATDRFTSTDRGFEVQEDMLIFQHAFCAPGLHIVTGAEPVALRYVLRGLPKAPRSDPSAPDGNKERKKAKTSGVPQGVLDEHPWLDAYLDQGKKKPDKKAHAPDADEKAAADPLERDAEEAKDPADIDLDTVYAEVAANKAIYDSVVELGGKPAFNVRVRGGLWTALKTGRATDCIKAACEKGTLAADFCARYNLHKEASFATKRYTADGASFLANAWAHRMEFFFQRWLTQAKEAYGFSDDDYAAYEEEPGFAAWVAAQGADSPAQARVAQIRALRPALKD
jgi:hypothetical protein